jgi:DNA polymerase-3 subunit gamma/tau
MRDALSALDQIISFKGSPVTEADVLAIFGLVSRGQLERLAAAILTGDMAGGLRIIDELDRGGKDLRRLVLELLEHFRNLLVYQQLGGDSTALDLTPGQLAALEQQAGLADAARVLRVAEHLAELEGRIRQALSRRTLLETVLVRCCRAATAATIDQLIRQLSGLQGVGEERAAEPAPAVPAAPLRPASEPPPAGSAPPTVREAAPPPVAARAPAAPAAPAVAHAAPPAPPAPAPCVPPVAAHAPAAPAARQPAPVAAAVPPVPPPAAAPTRLRRDPAEDKGVKAALDLFNGQIVKVEEPRES